MLNSRIYFWHKDKTQIKTEEKKDLIEKFIIYSLHNIKAIKTVIKTWRAKGTKLSEFVKGDLVWFLCLMAYQPL